MRKLILAISIWLLAVSFINGQSKPLITNYEGTTASDWFIGKNGGKIHWNVAEQLYSVITPTDTLWLVTSTNGDNSWLDSTITYMNSTFSQHDTRITQNTDEINLTSTSVFGGVTWINEDSKWGTHSSTWDFLANGLKKGVLDSLAIHRSGIQINSDSVNIFSSRTRNGSSMVSYINLAPSNIKISSPHIEFSGTAIFKALNGTNDSTSINGNKVRSGIIQSNNWSTTKGSYYDLTSGMIKLGGSTNPAFMVDSLGIVTATGVVIRDGSIGLGATSYSAGNGVWLSSTAGSMFRVGNASGSRMLWNGTNLEIYNSSNAKVASFGATNSFSGFSITGDLTMGASGTIKTAGAGEGANGFVLDAAGLRGYSATLGTVFNLPTDGSAPTFSSGIINYTTFNVNTNAVIRTSATVGDGSASSAGILINNTGFYATEANQTLANANIKILTNGTGSFKGALTSGSTITGATITGGTIQTSASGARAEMSATNGFRIYDADGYYSSLTQSGYTGLATSGGLIVNGGLGVTGNIAGNTISSTTYIIAQTLLYGRTGLNIGDPSSSGVWNFNINSSGQLTKVNNTAASGNTGKALISDGTSFTPTTIPVLVTAGNPAPANYYVATTSGGATTTQLSVFSLVVNGVEYYVFGWEP